jgi:zinc and cadmium transporter
MNSYSWLAVYSLAILCISLFGGSVPLLGRVSHSRLQFYLSASAGVMLGASFFHVMPDAMELSGASFGWWMSLGVVGLFCIERFIAPHSHEIDGNGHHHPHGHGHHHHDHSPSEHAHEHAPTAPVEHAKDHRAAAPAVAGWMAVFGLTIHTFMNGVGLAGAVQAVQEPHAEPAASAAAVSLPGLAMFLAIFLHKPADALAISTVLSRKGVPRRLITLVQLGFALMVPIGATVFCLTAGSIEEGLRGQLTGAALSFSAGTFLFIALSDLLPEVQFHRHDRVPLFLALVAGVALMGGIAILEEQGHVHEHGAAATSSDSEHKAHGEHDEEHDADHHGHQH